MHISATYMAPHSARESENKDGDLYSEIIKPMYSRRFTRITLSSTIRNRSVIHVNT